LRVAGICRDINWPEGLRGEVIDEIDSESRTLERLSKPTKRSVFGYALALLLLAVSLVLILIYPGAVISWFIVAFVLYSFNFIILFLPTTRKGKKDESCRRTIGRDALEPIKFLLKKKSKLAVEVGLTMFLGGMVPLALSFFVLFGIGLFLAVYFAYFATSLDAGLALSVIIQVLMILLFFVVLLLVRPDAQGLTRIARSFRNRYEVARQKSRWYTAAVILAIGLTAVGFSMLLVGAILLTGGVLGEVIGEGGRVGLSVLIFVLIFAAELVVMRHFQVVASRRMAKTLIEKRLLILRKDVLDPLISLLEQGELKGKENYDKEEFERIKANFFNVVIYAVYELNFFGFAPIYIVGPNVKYIIDERVLPYLGRP
jgi:hypothetical protein